MEGIERVSRQRLEVRRRIPFKYDALRKKLFKTDKASQSSAPPVPDGCAASRVWHVLDGPADGLSAMTWSIDSRKLSASLVAACLAVGWSGAALAQAPQPWTIQGKLTGKPKNLEGSESKNSKDVSGIACATESGFPRLCLIADDETQGAQIIILQDGKLIAGDFVRLIDDSFVGKPLELDAEGVAFGRRSLLCHRFTWPAAP
ncbi:hypothetical protein [Mesorhizobium sp. M0091]|uniref:hypothetical protein n=1 Tax=Mesorhizobium sp. M0091 TaxID=2956875 RepID=UPI0033363E4E